MSPSKNGLNAEFYKWIDDVRRAMRKEKELQEKLRYYNMRFVGCKSVSYDRIGSAGTSGAEKDLYYWLDKIDVTERRLQSCQSTLKQLKTYISILSDSEQEAFKVHILNVNVGNHTRNSGTFVKITGKNTLARKWDEVKPMLFKN